MLGTQPNHSSGANASGAHTPVIHVQGAARANGAGPNSSVAEYMTSMDHAKKSTLPAPSGPIIAANCISCMGMVRISHSMAVNTTVRCPHCQESFVLSELLDQSLPPLEVVVNPREADDADAPYIDTLHIKRDEQANKPAKPRVKFEIPKALKDGAKRKRRRRRRSRSSSSGSNSPGSASAVRSSRTSGSQNVNRDSNYVIPSSAPTTGDTTTMGEAIERRRSRRNRDARSVSEVASYRGKVRSHAARLKDEQSKWSAEDFIKVIGGSLFALPIAYLMLFWVFKADPLGIANPMSKVAPFAVPASLQSELEPKTDVQPTAKVPTPSDFDEPTELEVFAPAPVNDNSERIAIPNIDPDEVFGQEFGL